MGQAVGTGATSRVVAAYDRTLQRTVAVKMVAAPDSPNVRRRFLREAHAAAKVSHPNVVMVYDAGQEDDQLYLVMELVDGGDLAGVLAAQAPLAVSETVAIAAQVLAGLEALTATGSSTGTSSRRTCCWPGTAP